MVVTGSGVCSSASKAVTRSNEPDGKAPPIHRIPAGAVDATFPQQCRQSSIAAAMVQAPRRRRVADEARNKGGIVRRPGVGIVRNDRHTGVVVDVLPISPALTFFASTRRRMANT